MEETIIAAPAEKAEAPLTRAEVERQLNEMAQRLNRQIEAGAQAESARQAELDSREEELRRREMTAKTREELEKRGLPIALAEALPFPSEEKLTAGLDALEQAFRAAVQQGVEERLLTAAPKKTSVKPLSELSDEEYYAAVSRQD